MTRLLLLDTDVFSFLFKRDSVPRCTRHTSSMHNPALVFKASPNCVIGTDSAVGRRTSKQSRHGHRQVPRAAYDDAMSQQWAEVMAVRRQGGRPIDCGDAWIAATALRQRDCGATIASIPIAASSAVITANEPGGPTAGMSSGPAPTSPSARSASP